MVQHSNQLRWLGAAGILAVGAAWAGVLVTSPAPASGPSAATLRALAERVRADAEEPDKSPIPPPPKAIPVALPTRKETPVAHPRLLPKRPIATAPPRAVAKITPTSVPAKQSISIPVASEDPVKNLALVGLTQEGSTGRAWLLDLPSRRQEEAAVGENAFGFTVKEVLPESVLLSRDAREYTLRLGEKSAGAALQLASTSDTNVDGTGGSGGLGGFGGTPGFGGQPGFGGPVGFRGQGGFGGRGGRNFGDFGGAGIGNSGRPSGRTTSSRSSRVSSSRTTANRSNRGSSGNTAVGGGFLGGRGLGGITASGATDTMSQFGTDNTSPTSNPQTSRRSGRQLLSGAQALKPPTAITNPQTQRRTGTATATATTTRSSTSGTSGVSASTSPR